MKKIAILLLVLGKLAPAFAGNLTAAEAKNHAGENATVCGVVASHNNVPEIVATSQDQMSFPKEHLFNRGRVGEQAR